MAQSCTYPASTQAASIIPLRDEGKAVPPEIPSVRLLVTTRVGLWWQAGEHVGITERSYFVIRALKRPGKMITRISSITQVTGSVKAQEPGPEGI